MASKTEKGKGGAATPTVAPKKKEKPKGTPDNLIPGGWSKALWRLLKSRTSTPTCTGTKVLGLYRDGKWKDARVIERLEVVDEDGDKTDKFKYYVHYIEVRMSGDLPLALPALSFACAVQSAHG